jgi:Oxygenase domain of the 2OGFeDO superfamily
MKFLQLSSQLSDREASALKGQKLTERHYTLVFSDTVAVRGVDKALVAVLLKKAIPQIVLDEVMPHLATMNGDLSNRATVVRRGAQAARIASSGIPELRKTVPKAVLQAHGGKGDQLGFFDYKKAAACRETSWTNKHPEVLEGCRPLIRYVDHVYRNTCPKHYERQMAKVNQIAPSLRLGSTAFTTVTVNKNNRTAAHTDKGDVRDGLGCLTTHGKFCGSYFVMPKFGIAFDVQPGDLLLANVHELHGNSAMAEGGERYSCVFYARERMHTCPRKEVPES